MRRIRFVDMEAQQREVGTEVGRAVASVLDGTDWILGREVARFEEEFADYCDAGGAVGTDSGLSALELALRAFGIGPGDEVVIPANTFIATALAVSSTGAEPVLVDADPRTHLIDPELIEAALTPRTRAIVPVHLYGQPADMDAIDAIAMHHNLVVVEDACQAHGARYHGRRAGSLGHAAAFSFYPGKNLGAYGDGGIVVSSDDSLLEEIRTLRNYGQVEKYHHEVKGFNRRLDTVQAAALRVKLRRLDRWNEARASAADTYRGLLRQVGLTPPHVAPGVTSVWHLYVVQVSERDEVRRAMQAAGVEVGIHYPVPIHQQPAYAELEHHGARLPVTESQADRLLSLPMHPFLDSEDIERVIDVLVASVGEHRLREAVLR